MDDSSENRNNVNNKSIITIKSYHKKFGRKPLGYPYPSNTRIGAGQVVSIATRTATTTITKTRRSAYPSWVFKDGHKSVASFDSSNRNHHNMISNISIFWHIIAFNS